MGVIGDGHRHLIDDLVHDAHVAYVLLYQH
jgi:hypothetical protein